MTLTRHVDGIAVVCSAAEEAAIRAEWAAADIAMAAAVAKRAADATAKVAATARVTAALTLMGVTLADLKNALA